MVVDEFVFFGNMNKGAFIIIQILVFAGNLLSLT